MEIQQQATEPFRLTFVDRWTRNTHAARIKPSSVVDFGKIAGQLTIPTKLQDILITETIKHHKIGSKSNHKYHKYDYMGCLDSLSEDAQVAKYSNIMESYTKLYNDATSLKKQLELELNSAKEEIKKLNDISQQKKQEYNHNISQQNHQFGMELNKKQQQYCKNMEQQHHRFREQLEQQQYCNQVNYLQQQIRNLQNQYQACQLNISNATLNEINGNIQNRIAQATTDIEAQLVALSDEIRQKNSRIEDLETASLLNNDGPRRRTNPPNIFAGDFFIFGQSKDASFCNEMQKQRKLFIILKMIIIIQKQI